MEVKEGSQQAFRRKISVNLFVFFECSEKRKYIFKGDITFSNKFYVIRVCIGK